MENTELLKAKALAPEAIGDLVLEWDTCNIIEDEVEYRMTQDDTRRKIRRLKDRAYREELPAIIDERIEKAKDRISKGMEIPEKYQKKDGSFNEELARKELRRGEQKEIRERIKEQVHKELFSEVSGDTFLFQMQYDDLLEALTEEMKALPDYSGHWKIWVSNFGWRELSGEKFCNAETGQRLLQEILPDTDCTFRIFKIADGSGLALQNFHHDSPTGKEWYKITPCAERK
jgi:hypothetical protein